MKQARMSPRPVAIAILIMLILWLALCGQEFGKCREGTTMTIRLVLMILAVVFLILAAAQVPSPRVNLEALGLSLWAMSLLVTV